MPYSYRFTVLLTLRYSVRLGNCRRPASSPPTLPTLAIGNPIVGLTGGARCRLRNVNRPVDGMAPPQAVAAALHPPHSVACSSLRIPARPDGPIAVAQREQLNLRLPPEWFEVLTIAAMYEDQTAADFVKSILEQEVARLRDDPRHLRRKASKGGALRRAGRKCDASQPPPERDRVAMRRAMAMVGASPAALLSGSRSAAVVIAACAGAALVLPLIGRALAALPDWGMKMHELHVTIRDSRDQRRKARRRAGESRARRRKRKH